MNDVYFGLTMHDNDYKGILIDTAEHLINNGLLSKSFNYNELKDDIIEFVVRESIRRGKETAKLLGATIKPLYEEESETYVRSNLKISFQPEIPKLVILNGDGEHVFIKIKTLESGKVECVGLLTY